MIFLPQQIPASRAVDSQSYVLEKWEELNCSTRVLLLNLMPQKAVTELDIARTIAATRKDAQIIPIKIKGQVYKNTPQSHMNQFYLNFDDVSAFSFTHLIITGAPVEQMPFESVRYWPELCEIMKWAETHVARTLYICWGAQAGLYYHYGIPKYDLAAKKFGIYSQRVCEPSSGLMRNLAPCFQMPNSRHTEIRKSDILLLKPRGLQVLAESSESGVGIVASKDLHQTFIVGHLEYEPNTLDNEYRRDKSKGLPIQPPANYYKEDGSVDYSWERAAYTFYGNWLTL